MRLKFNIAQRITFAFLLMIGLVLLASGAGLFFIQSADETINSAQTGLDDVGAVSNLEIAWLQVVATIDNMLLTRQTSLIDQRLNDQLVDFSARLAALNQQEAALNNIRLLATLNNLAEELTTTVGDVTTEAEAGNWARAQIQRHTELASLQRRLSESLTSLRDEINSGVDASVTESLALQQSTGGVWVAISLIAVIAGAVAAFLTARGIIGPVNRLAMTARAIQDGDLSQRADVDRHDELGVMAAAFNNMTEQLGQSIYQLESNVSELERANQERAALITQLEEALLFKDQFLATMSHELRTPLNAIQGYAGLALDEEVEEDVAYMLERIKQNSKRLLGLINDILDISRINANRIEIVARPINLNELVQGWHDDFEQQAVKQGLAFNLEIDEALPESIIGDEERLTQIAANLLQNALKFTQKGGVRLKVNRDGADWWAISITDTGQGIPETWQHLIFDEFRQVDSSSKRKYGGAGLGLSIVKKLCLMMGGSVSVNSKLDVGSTFTVKLPLQVEAEATADKVAVATG